MCRKKYFILITDDPSTSTLQAAYNNTVDNLNKIKQLCLPFECGKLLNTEINLIQLVYDNPNSLSENDTTLESNINWADIHDEQKDVPVHKLETSENIAAALHNLVEKLPLLGSYELTVYCQGPIFSTETIQHWELFSALLRLHFWCFSDVLFLPNESCQNLTDKWDNIIRVESNNPINNEICLWKGNLILQPDSWLNRLKICYNVNYDFNEHSNEVLNTEPDLLYRVSHRLELLKECYIDDVSMHLFYPTKLKLKPFYPLFKSKEDSLVEYFCERKSVKAMIARFRYYPIFDTEENSLTIADWKKAIVDDTFRTLINNYPEPETGAYMDVLICWNNDIADELSVYLSKTSSEFSDIFLNKVTKKIILPCASDLKICRKFLSSNAFTCREIGDEFPTKGKGERKLSLVKFKVTDIDHDETIQEDNPPESMEKELELEDPCDWIERRYAAKIQEDDDDDNDNDDLQNPKITCKSNIGLDVTQYFDENGYAKGMNPNSSENMEILKFKAKYAKEQVKKLTELPWPELKDNRFHDVYYYNEKSEADDTRATQLKSQLLEEETTSKDFKTFIPKLNGRKSPKKAVKTTPRSKKTNKSPRRNTPKSSTRRVPKTPKKSGGPSPSKKTRTPAKKRATSPTLVTNQNESSPQKSVEITKKRLFGKNKSTTTPKKTRTPSKKSNKPMPTLSPAVKETPSKNRPIRKRQTPVKYPNTMENRTNTPSKKIKLQPKPTAKSKLEKIQKQELDTQTTKKLRNAVVNAFESRNIKMSDAIFKTCGKRLFNICKEYGKDLEGKPGASAKLKQIAEAHIDQVIAFEKSLKKM